MNTLCANIVSTWSSMPNAAGKYSGGSMTNRYAVAPNHSTRLVGSPWRRSRTIAKTSASTAPTTMVSSRTGRVQFSRANGLRNSTSPPASSHEKPSSCRELGEGGGAVIRHQLATCGDRLGCACDSAVYQRVQS